MKDEEFKAVYKRLKPRYELISEIISARRVQNITQEEVSSYRNSKIKYK